MNFEFEIPLTPFWQAAGWVGGASLVFGIFTALWPRRSIALYEWLMARINWRVSPIDEAREVRTTQLLGILLIILSLALLNVYLHRPI
jgi:hypothetical protein